MLRNYILWVIVRQRVTVIIRYECSQTLLLIYYVHMIKSAELA